MSMILLFPIFLFIKSSLALYVHWLEWYGRGEGGGCNGRREGGWYYDRKREGGGRIKGEGDASLKSLLLVLFCNHCTVWFFLSFKTSEQSF